MSIHANLAPSHTEEFLSSAGLAKDPAALKIRAERFGAALDNAPSPQILPERLPSGNEAAMDIEGAFHLLLESKFIARLTILVEMAIFR